MTLQQITTALNNGCRVYWYSKDYEVFEDATGKLKIKCLRSKSCINLVLDDGVTLNGDSEDFFVWTERDVR